jgi:hypothetical protein
LKRSKLSRLDFKFRINILAKIYKKIKLINRSKLRSRLRSNIAPKLGRLISYYQYYNTKSTNKISNLLKEYNLMLLENNIQKKNGELNSFSLLDTFKGNSHKILNSSLKNTGINKKIIQGLDSL